MDIIIKNNNVLLRSLSNSTISDSPLPGKEQVHDMREEPGGCTGDHAQEQVTSPPGEKGPTEVVHTVQGASSSEKLYICLHLIYQ